MQAKDEADSSVDLGHRDRPYNSWHVLTHGGNNYKRKFFISQVMNGSIQQFMDHQCTGASVTAILVRSNESTTQTSDNRLPAINHP